MPTDRLRVLANATSLVSDAIGVTEPAVPVGAPSLRYFVSGATGLVALRFASVGLGFAISAIVARSLGAAEFGVFAFAVSVATMLALPSTGGLPMLLMREIAAARTEGRPEAVVGVIRWGYLVHAMMATGVAVLATLVWAVLQHLDVWSWDRQQTAVAAMVLLVVPVMGFLQIQRGIVTGYERPVLGGLGEQLFRPLVMVALLLGMAPLLAHGSVGALGLHIAAMIVAVLATAVLMQRTLPRATLGPRYIRWRDWTLALLPLTATTAITVVANHTDILMLGMLRPPEEVGVYRIAAQMAVLAAIAGQILRSLSAPRIAVANAKGDRARIRAELIYTGRAMTAAAFAFVVIFAIVGQPTLKALFGADFAGALWPCLILALGTLISACFGLVGVTLQVTRNAHLVARAAVFAAVANVVLNLLLVPLYGASGAAVGTSFALVVMQAQLWWSARRVLDVRTDIFQRVRA